MRSFGNLIYRFRFDFGVFLSISFGSLIRLYKIDRQSLWGDELYSLYASSIKNWTDFFSYLANDPHPPLFQILFAIWIQLLPEVSELSIKLFPIIISIANLLILWFLTKSWEGRRRFIFLFLISFSPGALYYAQEVRSYSLLLFLASVLVVLFINFRNSQLNMKRFLVLLFISICISYVHLFGFIFVGSFYFLFWINDLITKNKGVKYIFFLGLFTLIAFIPFLIQLMNGSKIATAGWIDPPGLVLYLSYYSLFFYTSKKFLFLTVIIPIILLGYVLFDFVKKSFKNNPKSQLSIGEICFLIALFIIITTSIFSFFKPIVTNRNWIVTLPLVYFFVSEKLEGILHKRIVLIFLFLITFLSVLDFKKNYFIQFKEDWRATTNHLIQKCDGPIVLTNASPEYIQIYLDWGKNIKLKPILLTNDIKLEQNNVCVVYRILGGNGIIFPENNGWKKLNQSIFYGFVVDEYLRK